MKERTLTPARQRNAVSEGMALGLGGTQLSLWFS